MTAREKRSLLWILCAIGWFALWVTADSPRKSSSPIVILDT